MLYNYYYKLLIKILIFMLISSIISSCDLGIVNGSDIPKDAIAIESIEEVQKIGNEDDYPNDGHYILVKDIDATKTENWNKGKGFDPNAELDHGVFDGNGHEIRGIKIKRSDESRVAIFRKIEAKSTVKDIQLENVEIVGASQVGALAAVVEEAKISNVKVDGSVEGVEAGGLQGVGGLVGQNVSGEISKSSSSAEVHGLVHVGGLVGLNRGGGAGYLYASGGGEIIKSYSNGKVSGKTAVGGLVGSIKKTDKTDPVSSVSDSYSTATVTGKTLIGGLVGFMRGGTRISGSYHNGKVTGERWVGGLLGEAAFEGEITESFSDGLVKGVYKVGGLVGEFKGISKKSYSKSTVMGDSTVGGFMGFLGAQSALIYTYSSGHVKGVYQTGGFIGHNREEYESVTQINRSYWDTESSNFSRGVGRGNQRGGEPIGLTTDEMTGTQAKDNMTGFDFEDTWQVVEGDYPILQWEEP